MAENKSSAEPAQETGSPAEQPKSESTGSAFSLNKIFDLTLLTQSKDGKETGGRVYNYFWKKFDFRGGRNLEKLQDEHPYCADPVSSMSKSLNKAIS